MATYSSRQFNQDASGAKRAAADGPVFITDRGRPAHVLMTIEEYERLKGPAAAPPRTIADMFAMDGEVSDEFDRILEEIREESRRETPRPVDLD